MKITVYVPDNLHDRMRKTDLNWSAVFQAAVEKELEDVLSDIETRIVDASRRYFDMNGCNENYHDFIAVVVKEFGDHMAEHFPHQEGQVSFDAIYGHEGE